MFCFNLNVMKINSIQSYQNYNFNTKKNNAKSTNNYTQNSLKAGYPSNYYLSFNGVKAIRFEKAKSIAEAKDFGRRILGIAAYDDFSNDSLDVINYINEGLVALKNNSRLKPRTPRYVNLRPHEKIQMCTRYFGGGELDVSSNVYGAKEIGLEIKRIFEELTKDGIISKTSINPAISTPEIEGLFEKLNKQYANLENLTYDEKIDLYNEIRVIYERTSQLNRFPKDLIVKMLEAGCWGEYDKGDIELFAHELANCAQDENFSALYKFLEQYDNLDFKIANDSFRHKTLFHEIGHLQDIDIFCLPSAGEFSDYGRYTKEMKEWVSDKKALKAAFEVSPYACYGVPEFIAEAYAWLLEGKELPQEARDLYKRLNGPKVVLRW